MNVRREEVITLLQSMLDDIPTHLKAACAILPPVVFLSLVREQLFGSSISWGAQNVYPLDKGAYTGEISGPMLKDYDCKYVLVGHSERRHFFYEDEKFVAEKFHHVKDHDMIPVLCVGETLEEREQGLTEAVIRKQLLAVTQVGSHFFRNCIVAYEPVWAIGTGQTASPAQAQEVHAYIRALVAQFDQNDANNLSVLYGGSVNEKNARSLFAMPDIDGGLVGGASLHAKQFVEIVECIN